MTHTYSKLFYHLVWSTKDRRPLILPSMQKRLYQYMGGIIKNIGADLLEIGGMQDHVHLLVYSKPDILISDLIRQTKARSTKWLITDVSESKNFSWQEGYGIFSVSYSQLPAVQNYIRNQELHHRTMSYDKEYLLFLTRNAIKYDERFVLG